MLTSGDVLSMNIKLLEHLTGVSGLWENNYREGFGSVVFRVPMGEHTHKYHRTGHGNFDLALLGLVEQDIGVNKEVPEFQIRGETLVVVDWPTNDTGSPKAEQKVIASVELADLADMPSMVRWCRMVGVMVKGGGDT